MKTINVETEEKENQILFQALMDAGDGLCKNASDMTSQVVRRRLRETGFRRLILPDKPISDSQLVMLPDTELPVVVELMEPDSPGAKTISFNDTADTAFYRGDKFVVIFHPVLWRGGYFSCEKFDCLAARLNPQALLFWL
jgi:hypothetical protein